MFKRIHLLLGFFMALYFLPVVNHKIIFFPMVLAASFIPDLDAVIAPKKDFKILQPLKNKTYKDFMHSYTVCVILSVIVALLYPILSLPFFIGYSVHLFFDSITLIGICPFWPSKSRITGFISPGSKTEKTIELMLVVFIVLLVLRYIF
ncbi:MAG: metal-dependent hydrolase [Nanoarchaeota archaeon]|nr:metal-dependent hydrolase [Nanoarchaeota archaeon]